MKQGKATLIMSVTVNADDSRLELWNSMWRMFMQKAQQKKQEQMLGQLETKDAATKKKEPLFPSGK